MPEGKTSVPGCEPEHKQTEGPRLVMRPIEREDLPQVADVHLLAFPDAAVSIMGHEVARRFYESLLYGPHKHVGYGAFVDGQLSGYVFGGRPTEAERDYLRSNVGYLSWRLLTHPWLLFRGRVMNRLVLSLRVLVRLQPKTPPKPAPSLELVEQCFGIQAIAVDPRRRRGGVGRVLLVAAEKAARKDGLTTMLLSVHGSNQAAVKFYLSTGWYGYPKGSPWDGGFMLRDLS